MKLIVEKNVLLGALQNASNNVIPRKSALPIIQNALLKILDGNTVQITSTDLDVTLEEKIFVKADPEAVGKAWVVDSKFFVNLLPKIKSEALVLEFKENTLSLIVDKNIYKTPLFSANDFPTTPSLGNNETDKIFYNTEIFKNYINKCLPFTANDETRPTIQGIHYMQIEKEVHLEAVDMTKLLCAKDTIEDSDKIVDVIIPKKFAMVYTKVYEEEATSLEMDNRFIVLTGETMRLFGRKIEGKFPNTKGIINQTLNSSMTIAKEDVIDALRRLLVLHSMYRVIIMSMSENGLVITTQSNEFKTEGKEVFENYVLEGEPVKIGMNPEQLITALSAFRSASVTMEFESKNKPIRIIDEVGAIRTLVMPLGIDVD